jgi:hypothetical protein
MSASNPHISPGTAFQSYVYFAAAQDCRAVTLGHVQGRLKCILNTHAPVTVPPARRVGSNKPEKSTAIRADLLFYGVTRIVQ